MIGTRGGFRSFWEVLQIMAVLSIILIGGALILGALS